MPVDLSMCPCILVCVSVYSLLAIIDVDVVFGVMKVMKVTFYFCNLKHKAMRR